MGRGNRSNKARRTATPAFKARAAMALARVAVGSDLPVSHARQQEVTEILEAAIERAAQGLSGKLPQDTNVDLLDPSVDASENEAIEEDTPSTPSILGDNETECPLGVRQNAPVDIPNSVSFVAEPEATGKPVKQSQHGEPLKRGTFASLFAGNRQQENGTALSTFEVAAGPVKLFHEDVEHESSRWEHSLVGYFGGKFPGKAALQQIVNAWKVETTIHHHSSGWIIFELMDKESQSQVLQGGPYMIFGRPLLLKVMPSFFNFDNDELSCFPVWVQFPKLPLQLWGPNSLGKLSSKMGKPICTDKFTACKERVSYARVLIEIDVAKEVDNLIHIELPNGQSLEQAVFIENMPRFCSHCKVMGHSRDGCKLLEKLKAKAVPKGKGDGKATATKGHDSPASTFAIKHLPPALPKVGNKFQILADVEQEHQGVQPIVVDEAQQVLTTVVANETHEQPGQLLGQQLVSQVEQAVDLGPPALQIHEQTILTTKAQRATRVSLSALDAKQQQIAHSLTAKQGQRQVAPGNRNSANVSSTSNSKAKQGPLIKAGPSTQIQVKPTVRGSSSLIKEKDKKQGAKPGATTTLGHFLADMGAGSPNQPK